VRWQLLQELVRSDRQVSELTVLSGQRQNLVSYHLGQLRQGGLVTARRSSADGRDTYYSIDLIRCRELLSAAGGALHPGLRLVPPPPQAGSSRTRQKVLFLCTGNSARSQMAEYLLRHQSGGRIDVASAGSSPKAVHPEAVAVMALQGIDLAGATAKHLSKFKRRRFDYVITLCDRVRETCPEFPGESMHWGVSDPALEPDGRAAFQRTAGELSNRITFFLHRLANQEAL
jgi:protein-tyrosine-phosphatase